jgi:hypothetical protein
MASLNHKFCVSERGIFLRGALDSSGKTGGGFCCFARRVVAATLCWIAGAISPDGANVRFSAGST